AAASQQRRRPRNGSEHLPASPRGDPCERQVRRNQRPAAPSSPKVAPPQCTAAAIAPKPRRQTPPVHSARQSPAKRQRTIRSSPRVARGKACSRLKPLIRPPQGGQPNPKQQHEEGKHAPRVRDSAHLIEEASNVLSHPRRRAELRTRAPRRRYSSGASCVGPRAATAAQRKHGTAEPTRADSSR